MFFNAAQCLCQAAPCKVLRSVFYTKHPGACVFVRVVNSLPPQVQELPDLLPLLLPVRSAQGTGWGRTQAPSRGRGSQSGDTQQHRLP